MSNDERFDDLARGIAKQASRRSVLKGAAGGLFGLLLAAVGVRSTAEATQPNGNAPCAQFCTDNFPPGDLRGLCVSQAAMGTGPCFQCGPAAPAGHGVICNGVCCPAGQVCTNGHCACPAGTEQCGGACVPVCPTGQVRGPNCTCVCP